MFEWRSSFSSGLFSALLRVPRVNDVSSYQHSARPSDHLTKIMDFGIAIHDEVTHETLACGTRMYSSPEQTRKKAKLDGRSGQKQRVDMLEF
jgi:serine/threonine protein kinase